MCWFKKQKSPKVVETIVTVIVEDSYYNPYKCPEVDVYVFDVPAKPKKKKVKKYKDCVIWYV